LPRCERFLSGVEFETEEWIGNYTAAGVDSKKEKIFP